MVFHVIAVRKEGGNEGHCETEINQRVLIEQGRKLGKLFNLKGVNKTSFKCGTLDNLMEQIDFFQKMEHQLETSCKRIESVYLDLMNEMNPIDLKKNPNQKPHEIFMMMGNNEVPVL